MNDVLTVDEAAKILDCHPNWIRELCRDGAIKCNRFGRSWMVDQTSLEEYKAKPRKPGPKSKMKEPEQ